MNDAKAGEAQRLYEPQPVTPERRPIAPREPLLAPEEIDTLLSSHVEPRLLPPEKLEEMLLRMDGYALQMVLRKVTQADIAALLTMCRPETKACIESQLSMGARRMLADEMKHAYNREQALVAREKICAMINRLEQAGNIILEMSPELVALREEYRARAASEEHDTK